ncbi:MAG TPA: phage/plasmid primase, P4 family [Thermomicrobiales bacterium]|nr:phage/plasmid primase, P4 family [Thermomicrobiales bacterium]
MTATRAKIDHALALAALGDPVVPLHTPLPGGRCSCEKVNCPYVGKHPRFYHKELEHGLKDATTDPAKLRRWWTRWADANIGWVLKHRLVIDIDRRNGGFDSLDELRRLHGETWLRTWTVITGNGEHHYFTVPADVQFAKTSHDLAPGIDVKLPPNSYVLGAGSTHPNGATYAWEIGFTPDDLDPLPAPDWLLARLPIVGQHEERASGRANGHSHADIGEDEPIPAGLRHRTLMSLAGTMRKRGMSAPAILAALLAENAERCQPPLDEAEVRSMAHYAGTYAPGEPTRFATNGYDDEHEEQAAEAESEEPTPQAEPESTRPNLNGYSHTDSGNADALAALFGKNLRYDQKRKEWLAWNRHRWKRDAESRVQVLAKRTAIARYKAAVDLLDKSDQMKASRWALASMSRKGREAMIALARYERPILDSGEGWDADPFLLGVPNGVVDLRTGELREGRREDKVTMQCRVAYDPDARAPRWERFLAEVFPTHPELIGWLRRCVGYSATGDTSEQVLFMPFGDGANGKGTLFRALRYVLGDYAHTMRFAALEHDERGNGATNDIADLVGRRFVMASETTDGRRFNEARIKALTGDDEVTARQLYGRNFSFRPVGKYWLAFNHKPIVRDDSYAFWRRVRLIPFLARFEGEREDKSLEATLQGEAAGILAWVVAGCLAWQREGLTPPDVVSESTEEYRRDSDSLREFLAERCVIEDGASIAASDIYAAYESWAGRAPDKLTRTMFGRLLARKFQTRHRKWGREYVGIRRKMGT